jgi:hypothetical protein
MGQVVQLVIPSKRQEDLAVLMQRLERQNRNAAMRKEILEIIEGSERSIEYHRCVIDYGHALLAQLDGGPNDAA